MANNNKTLIIAEAGVNHNGSEELAFKLVDAAVEAGADIVKFQTFKAQNLASADAQQAEYQSKNIGQKESQLNMLRRLELSYDSHHRLLDYCRERGIEFLSTAFDQESLNFIVNDLELTKLKLPSGEITNAPLVLAHARTRLPIIVSTGMASLSEIEQVLGIIAFGYTASESDKPSEEAFERAYFSQQGQEALKEKVSILHCTTEYPAPLVDINLRAMKTIRNAFHLPVGYSDHSEGIIVPISAVSLGAGVIEKHFTLDKNLEGPDHKASLEPHELKAMVKGIRDVELVLGDGVKGPRPSEVKNKPIARKSLVAARDIKKGEIISEQDLTAKRPGNGMSPIKFWQMIGSPALRDFKSGEVISE